MLHLTLGGGEFYSHLHELEIVFIHLGRKTRYAPDEFEGVLEGFSEAGTPRGLRP